MPPPKAAPSIVSRLWSALVVPVLSAFAVAMAVRSSVGTLSFFERFPSAQLCSDVFVGGVAFLAVFSGRFVISRLRIFDRFIWGQVWSGMFTGVMVLSGVMVLGNVYKKMDQLLGDTKLPFWFVIKFMALVIPYSLVFTIPWAFLTSILLVYGRMSADNEMVSIRMTGTPMWRICAPVFLMAAMLSGLCFYVNVDLAPSSKNQIKHMFYDVASDNPITLFQEGRVLDKMPGYRIYTGRQKKGTGELENLELIQLDGDQEKQFIRAKSAKLVRTPGKQDFDLELHDATFEQLDVAADGGIVGVKSPQIGETAITFPLSELKGKTDKINASMKDTSALWQEVNTNMDSVTKEPLTRKQHSVSLTELSKRYSFSLACVVFALVGIPLGITAQRRETTMGFVLSLLTAVVYLVFIFFADGQNDRPAVYPHLLMWLPNVIFLTIGGVLFYRLSKR